jgi:hypothetical protein
MQPLVVVSIAHRYAQHIVGLPRDEMAFQYFGDDTVSIHRLTDFSLSCAREIVLGFEEPRFIGRIAPRAVFPADRIEGDPIRDCTKWWAPDRYVLACPSLVRPFAPAGTNLLALSLHAPDIGNRLISRELRGVP